jgi:hypothetical protein
MTEHERRSDGRGLTEGLSKQDIINILVYSSSTILRTYRVVSSVFTISI